MRKIQLIVLSVMPLLLSGCFCVSDKCIVDLETGNKKYIPSPGPYREIVAYVDEKDACFTGMSRVEKNKLMLRKLTFSGDIVEEKTIPMICGGGYAGPNEWAFFKNGKALLWFDSRTKCYNLMDIDSGISEPIAQLKVHLVYGTIAISPAKVILIFTQGRNMYPEIGIYDDNSKSYSKIYEYTDISANDFFYSKSSSRLYVVDEEECTRNDVINVLDIPSGKVIERIPVAGSVYSVTENPQDPGIIFYVTHTTSNKLVKYDLRLKRYTDIRYFGENTSCIKLALTSKGLVCEIGHGEGRWDDFLTVLDPHTGRTVDHIYCGLDGRVFVLDNGKKLLVECR